MTNKGRGSKGPGPIEARARGFCPPSHWGCRGQEGPGDKSIICSAGMTDIRRVGRIKSRETESVPYIFLGSIFG